MKFSSGMYQRLGIAAPWSAPSVLCSRADAQPRTPATTAHFWAPIALWHGQQTTVLLATHNFAEAAAVGDRPAPDCIAANCSPTERWATPKALTRSRAFYFSMTG